MFNKKAEFTEIFRLKQMLENADIPFQFFDRKELRGYQIKCEHKGEFVCSVIQNAMSYGNEENLLEIMGLLTEEEKKQDDVLGWLSAEDVFARIKKFYDETRASE